MIHQILWSLTVFMVIYVASARHESRLPKTLWTDHCKKHQMVLNDCNWCRCQKNAQYKCDARDCSTVDMFGHFNDAIRETDPGMEGHGYWRTSITACEPGVLYRRPGLACTCAENGQWPNPVCRDTFRILHQVEVTEYATPNNTQTCTPGKLHLIDCNVCHCTNGTIDPELCTKRNCSDENVMRSRETKTSAVDEIYAVCNTSIRYKFGCQSCVCLRNNRLLCDNCTIPDESNSSMCSDKSPGEYFTNNCNFCYCDNKENIYCTAKKCLSHHAESPKPNLDLNYVLTTGPGDITTCIPGTKYRRDCNECHCFVNDSTKYLLCTKMRCKFDNIPPAFNWEDCVLNTTYEVNNLICECRMAGDTKEELCYLNKHMELHEGVPKEMSSMHGYCEPMHVYNKDCNTCRCLPDGKTTVCTSKVCRDRKRTEFVEFIPFVEYGNYCPTGQVYRVNCNVCYCLANGNAICSAKKCDSRY